MKKIGLILGILVMVLFTGCGSKDKGSEGGSTTIRFGWWGGSARHEATLKAIELFEEKNPGIKVKAEYSGWGGYNDKLTTQVVGNSAPDVMQVNWNMLYALRGGSFYDLKDVPQIDLSNYPEEILEGVEIDGRTVAVPYGITGKVFYYNKTTYEKAGLEIPTTFEEMIAAAPVFKEKLGRDFYPFDTDQYGAFLLALYYLEQKTGKAFIENDRVAYSVDELTEALEFYSGLVAKGVFPSLKTRASAGFVPLDQHPDWINGKYAGTYEWDSAAAKWQGSLAEGQKLAVGEMPKDLGSFPSAFNKISMTFAINRNTKNVEAAGKLIEFLISDPEAIEILGLSRGLPINAKALEKLEADGQLEGLNYLGNVKVMENLGKGIHYHFEHGQMQQLYRDTIEELGNGVITEKQAAEKIYNGVNGFLAANIK